MSTSIYLERRSPSPVSKLVAKVRRIWSILVISAFFVVYGVPMSRLLDTLKKEVVVRMALVVISFERPILFLSFALISF